MKVIEFCEKYAQLENEKEKLDLLKWKSYAPTNLLEVEDINRMDMKRVKIKYGKLA